MRKLERISQLDAKVNELKDENSDLASIIKSLKHSVCKLKQEVLDHVNTGCQISVADEPSMYGH
jgi:transcription factor AP-1